MIVRHLYTLGDEARLHTDAGTRHGLVLERDGLGFAPDGAHPSPSAGSLTATMRS